MSNFVSLRHVVECEIEFMRISVTHKFDPPFIRFWLIHEIVDCLKDGDDPIKTIYLGDYLVRLLQSVGSIHLYKGSSSPSYDEAKVEQEDVLVFHQRIWEREFGSQGPEEIEITISFDFYFEHLALGIANARQNGDIDCSEAPEMTPEFIRAYDVLWHATGFFMMHGEMGFDDLEISEEVWTPCKKIVRHWFPHFVEPIIHETRSFH